MKEILVFDLGGVLINLDVRRCAKAFADLIGEANVRAILGMDNHGEGIEAVSIAHRQLMRDFERGLIEPDTFIDAILQYAPEGTTADQVLDAWISMLLDLPQERLTLLASLRQQGHRLYLLSNGNDLHWNYIDRTYAVSSYFDEVFLSQRMHCAKPEEEIFRRVQESIHPTPTDSVLFVDDLAPNRLAAEQIVGWRTFADLDSLQSYLAANQSNNE